MLVTVYIRVSVYVEVPVPALVVIVAVDRGRERQLHAEDMTRAAVYFSKTGGFGFVPRFSLSAAGRVRQLATVVVEVVRPEVIVVVGTLQKQC